MKVRKIAPLCQVCLYVINVGGVNVWLRAVTVGIAVMNNGNNTFRTKWLHNNSAIWPGLNTITIQQLTLRLSTDGVPPDGTPVIVFSVLDGVWIVASILLFVGSLVFIVICLGFIIIFRDKKYSVQPF